MSFISDFKDATIGVSGYPRLMHSKKNAFGYMALLLAVVMAIACLIETVNAHKLFAYASDRVARGPTFTLKDGRFHFEGDMPYKVRNGFLIVDTTGKTKPEDVLKDGRSGMVITEDSIYQLTPLGTVQQLDLARFKEVTLTNEDVSAWLPKASWVIPIIFLLMYPLQLGIKALDAAILAFVAVAYGSTFRRQVPFALGFKTALYAMSMSTLLQWVWPGMRVPSLGSLLIFWGLSTLYLVLGLRAYYTNTGPDVDLRG